MSTSPDPRAKEQDRGLDGTAEVERPWSSVARIPDELPCIDDGLRVVVEYVVVEGEDAHALARRQAVAVRMVLEWLYAHRGGAARDSRA
ncbi:hypothetical protein [Streptomyces sp. NBC_01190]|uniref:hypothetical protein n=1 Tax=Streptomyces sp. NBC_01190 TaxID=2903767 RepID=UPI00386CBF53|nr:hypothetical protein OG519_29115 [Streptomyces sp. NBC_01190]